MTLPLNIDWQQILLHLFNFVVLFAVLYFLLYSPVKKFMEERTCYYKKMDEDAKKNLADSEKIQKEYEEKLAASEEEIADMKAAAFKKTEAKNALRMKEAEDAASKILKDARADAELMRDKILKDAQGEVSDMVASFAEKLVKESTTSEAYDDFLNSAERGEAHE